MENKEDKTEKGKEQENIPQGIRTKRTIPKEFTKAWVYRVYGSKSKKPVWRIKKNGNIIHAINSELANNTEKQNEKEQEKKEKSKDNETSREDNNNNNTSAQNKAGTKAMEKQKIIDIQNSIKYILQRGAEDKTMANSSKSPDSKDEREDSTPASTKNNISKGSTNQRGNGSNNNNEEVEDSISEFTENNISKERTNQSDSDYNSNKKDKEIYIGTMRRVKSLDIQDNMENIEELEHIYKTEDDEPNDHDQSNNQNPWELSETWQVRGIQEEINKEGDIILEMEEDQNELTGKQKRKYNKKQHLSNPDYIRETRSQIRETQGREQGINE